MKEIVTYKQGSFTDFEGKEHHVIVCGVSHDVPEGCVVHNVYHDEMLDEFIEDNDNYIKRSLMIGVAICNPLDEFDESRGKAIAYNKAKNPSVSSRALYANSTGLISTKLVDAVLEQELEFVCKNPHLAIKGYATAEKKFKEGIIIEQAYNQLPPMDKYIVDAALKGHDVAGDMLFAKALLDKRVAELNKQ